MMFTLTMKTVYHVVSMGATIFTLGLKKNSVMLYYTQLLKMFETVLDRKEGPGKILVRRINI